jgi:hypothetical protein
VIANQDEFPQIDVVPDLIPEIHLTAAASE